MESKSDALGRAMQAAWTRVKKAQTRMWSEWMTVGEGLLEGRRVAMQRAGTNRPEGKGYGTAFSEWLNHYKVADIHKTVRGHLLCIMEERAAIEEMRATWPDNQRRELNHPTTVWRKWQALTREKPKPKPSAAEHGRAQRIIEEQQAHIAELEASRDGGLNLADDAKTIARALFDTTGADKAKEILGHLSFLVMKATMAAAKARGEKPKRPAGALVFTDDGAELRWKDEG